MERTKMRVLKILSKPEFIFLVKHFLFDSFTFFKCLNWIRPNMGVVIKFINIKLFITSRTWQIIYCCRAFLLSYLYQRRDRKVCIYLSTVKFYIYRAIVFFGIIFLMWNSHSFIFRKCFKNVKKKEYLNYN